MSQPLIFATGNPNKVKEINQILNGTMEVISMRTYGVTEEIPETTGTIPGNALQKARYLVTNYQVDCFSEDTGLEVDALDGAPGVDTAIYGGPERSDTANIERLLKELRGKLNRTAQFRTVIALIINGHEFTFEGICKGTILHTPRGEGGFGYDPVFQPLGYDQTFAEMPASEKNEISHRAKAMKQLITFLKNY